VEIETGCVVRAVFYGIYRIIVLAAANRDRIRMGAKIKPCQTEIIQPFVAVHKIEILRKSLDFRVGSGFPA
jgi:hypothetical protein